LPYELENWEHCTDVDRRLYQERMMGLQAPSRAVIQANMEELKKQQAKQEKVSPK
jgi:hypothetical protein